jgi:hypothetical protein
MNVKLVFADAAEDLLDLYQDLRQPYHLEKYVVIFEVKNKCLFK